MDDEKITELYINFGYEGIGLFFCILEKIAKQEKPIKESVLKKQLHVGKKLEKCWNFMESLGIICTKNGETFNEQLLNYSKKYQIKKEKNKERVAYWRDNQEDIKNVTHYNDKCNNDVMTAKESKVKESKVNNINNSIFDFKKSCIDFGFDESLVKDWISVRKNKKASNTETAFNIFIGQVKKSGLDKNTILRECVYRNWISFKASWLDNQTIESLNTEQPPKPKIDKPITKLRRKDFFTNGDYIAAVDRRREREDPFDFTYPQAATYGMSDDNILIMEAELKLNNPDGLKPNL